MTTAALTPPPQAPAKVLDVPQGFELIDGQLVEKAMGVESSWVGSRVFKHLDAYATSTRCGVAFVADTGYRCFPRKPTQVRKPDVSLLRCDPDAYVPPTGWETTVPTLVVEVVSPNESVYDLDDRIADFQSAGTPLIWVINPQRRQATIHRIDGTAAIVTEPADLSGENVLPGLVVPLAAVLPTIRATPP